MGDLKAGRLEGLQDSHHVGPKPVTLVLRVQLELPILAPERGSSQGGAHEREPGQETQSPAQPRVPVDDMGLDENLARTHASKPVDPQQWVAQVIKHSEKKEDIK